MSAISGIEQALWDIKGKYHATPVYELLGGRCRDRIKVYSWVGGDIASNVVEQVRLRRVQGFQTVKMNATGPTGYIGSHTEVDAAVARMGELRQAFGNEVDVAVDFHGRVHKGIAKVLVRELEPFRPLFYEEPVLAEHSEALAAVAAHTTVPIATGERLYTRWGFKQLIASGVVDIVQPDISHAGGLLECKKIAAMAEAYDIAVAPHCPLGPIAAAASLQLAAGTPNFTLQELSLNMHYHAGADLLDYVVNKSMFTVNDGYVPIPTGPGLGINIDEEKIRAAAITGYDWRAPQFRLEDGSFAEW